MTKPLFYQRDGTPYPTTLGDPDGSRAWSKDFADTAGRRIAWTELPSGRVVSTVFLGLDHSFSERAKPIIFETMVFAKKLRKQSIGEELDCKRYCTESEAIRGHAQMVEKWTHEPE